LTSADRGDASVPGLALPFAANAAAGTSAMMLVSAIVSKLFVLIMFSPNSDLKMAGRLESLTDNRNGHASNSILLVHLDLYLEWLFEKLLECDGFARKRRTATGVTVNSGPFLNSEKVHQPGIWWHVHCATLLLDFGLGAQASSPAA
jgi:hypothetical protein